MSGMPQMTDLATLIGRFDVFIVDQFGVLRDDEGVYEGAGEALAMLKAAGKTVVVLSNSGRSGDHNARRLARLGIGLDRFDRFVTSGDVAAAILERDPAPGGKRCFTVSTGGDTELADRLGMTSVSRSEEADLVVISGSAGERVTLDAYRALLAPAARRGVPCVCTNPDRVKLADGATAPGAGAIADLYEEMGGRVSWFGKPHPDIYGHALTLCGDPPKARVVCIGDSIENDIAGASGVGLASVLVRTGILADAGPAQLLSLMAQEGCRPTWLMSRFR